MTPNNDKERDQGPWKCGDEFLPYHPSASHVNPDRRDGWNACYYASRASMLKASPEVEGWRPIETLPLEEIEYAPGNFAKWAKADWVALGRHDTHGWVSWVGTLGADLWLERDSTRACGDCEQPTHWMPLPQPPASTKDSSGVGTGGGEDVNVRCFFNLHSLEKDPAPVNGVWWAFCRRCGARYGGRYDMAMGHTIWRPE